MQDGNRLQGFSIDLWKSISDDLKLKSRFVVSPTVKTLLASVQSGKADIGISAISITAQRERVLDFSQPMYDSGLQIMARSESSGSEMPSFFSLFFSRAMLQLLGVILLMILLPAHIVWLFERHHPEGIIENKRYFPGIFKAVWWAAGTLGAQADEMPRSHIGRFVAVIWMFVGLAFVAYFTATITATLTVQQLYGDIKGPDDLPGKRVATTLGSTSASYLRQRKIAVVEYTKIEDAYKALLNEDVKAVVFDAPVLLYYAANGGHGKVQIVGPVFRKEDYGIVLPTGSALRKPINNALLRLKENGTYDEIYNKWFGDSEPSS